jgi:adenine-specific DNA-methyltransferase
MMDKQDKLPMMSKDLANEKFEVLMKLFPNIVTETLTDSGEVVKAIDVDALKQEINQHVVSGKDERYQFTWPDKKKSVLLANSPIAATLRPCREESVDFDNTENLYLEGDNLDVLKLLRETYLSRIKLIYIDPPYNTGGDFIYNDDFSQGVEDFLRADSYYDEEKNRMRANRDANGRFHTDWLNMMYPRLRIARDLLTENGIIFVHIDDNEVETLGKLCNEVFGEQNFINIVTVKTKVGGVSGSSEGKSLKDTTEFIWIFAKNKAELLLNPVYIMTKLSDRIKSYEIEGRSWKYTSVMIKLEDKVLIKEDTNRGIRYFGYTTLETASISAFARAQGITEEQVYDSYADRIFRTTNAQSSVRQTIIKETKGHSYPMYSCEYIPIKGKNEGTSIEVLYKSGSTDDQRNMMMFLSDVVEKVDGVYYYMDKVSSLWDDIDYNNLTKEGNVEFPNGKKPIKLLQRMLALTTNKDSLVLDFFSGSGSMGHAVMQQNAEDGGHRKYIMVQLPEMASQTEYSTICDLAKSRLRNAGLQIIEESPLTRQGLDVGFRVFKLDSSNMKDVYYTPEEYAQMNFNLDGFMDNIKPDRTEEDLLFQVMLDLGVPLSAKIKKEGNLFYVDENYLVACFGEVDSEIIMDIAKKKPYYAVFRDSSFMSDSSLVNVDQIFNTYSPQTIRRVL